MRCGMTKDERLMSEIEQVLAPFLDEVLHFVLILKARATRMRVAASVSESCLSKDWLRPEEDEAWGTL
jgi:hypothetical protein